MGKKQCLPELPQSMALASGQDMNDDIMTEVVENAHLIGLWQYAKNACAWISYAGRGKWAK